MSSLPKKILIIEDEPRTAQWIKVYLERAGFSAGKAGNGEEGLKLARESNPDLILLDLNLPRLNGIELCRILRKESDVPVIMTTARGAKEDKLKGLEGGADDYMVKPFDPDELVARVKALLRRSSRAEEALLTCGPLEMDRGKELVRLSGKTVALSHYQFLILKLFMEHPGQVFTRIQLMEQALEGSPDIYDRSIDAHIKRLRKLIHSDSYCPIETVYGAGYRFQC
ncbi:response regulator transcription factor [Spirochaeta isovalerica]|uniref:DNA-binding response OmpR family regulator n=1 Tax=Spirochaeta isovalerica TaxID=150 RepID=A0A841RDU7_9SPIO|nr:response regulator transcription factor [Spirochaeta isovalerica]MBB6480798.1 DNA-binding response OmpR family regulator [Spirochaeta isovalerica]